MTNLSPEINAAAAEADLKAYAHAMMQPNGWQAGRVALEQGLGHAVASMVAETDAATAAIIRTAQERD